MKILQVHNYYQQTGGEDTVVAQEKALLESNGHKVTTYYKHNDVINSIKGVQKIGLLKETTWSKKTYKEVDAILKNEKVDICHVHNILPIISPSIYYASKDNNVPVVQTLHNYRLICTNGLLMRNERICEDCLGRSAYGAISKKCYRNSAIQTYAVARMLQKNMRMGTWSRKVDAYLCLTEMARQKFIEHGLPEDKLIVKPNFIKVDVEPTETKSNYLLFAGRLTSSKGVELIKSVAKKVDYPIKMVGNGELSPIFKNSPNVELLGKRPHNETLNLIKDAKALLFPSLWYEGMPMTIIEAFALKTPVIASDLGAMSSMIQHQKTGLLFDPSSINSLLEKVNYCLNEDIAMRSIANNAFMKYETEYSSNANYRMLKEVYSTLKK
ncbi:MAG: hypothetical protein CMC96_12995 [Flavobacteriales bacterium]|nr:hypothetical protein [Flavobacteriales bacterium]